MSVAAAISHHPLTATAVGEIVGQVLETLGPHPDLVVLFATPHHAPTFGAAAQAVNTLLSPTALIGGISTNILANGSLLEGGPALALWVANVGPVRTFSFGTGAGRVPEWLRPEPPPTMAVAGAQPGFEARTVLLLADQARQDPDLLAELSTLAGAGPVVGGVLDQPAPAGTTIPGDTSTVGAERDPHLLVGPTLQSGSVGVALGGGLALRTHVVSGTVPVGPPMVVTDSSGRRILELDAQPARNRLLDVALDAVAVEDLALLARSLYVTTIGEAGQLARVVAIDRRAQSITLAGTVMPGGTVRFFLPASDTEVAAQTGQLLGRASQASGALIFPSATRLGALAPQGAEAGAGTSELPGAPPLLDPFAARVALLETMSGLPAIGCACAPPLTVANGVMSVHPLGVVVALLSTSSGEFTERQPFGHGDTR